MSEENFVRSYAQITLAIDYCLAENLIMPSLVLIYSAIDSVSWLASDDETQNVKKRFQAWVDTWMLQKHPLPCTAEELYAARCGILHTLTPDSDLSEKKGVRRISYAWGKAKQENLDESIKLLDYPGIVAVHINDIYYSFKNGFADFIETLEKNVKRREQFAAKMTKYFANMDIPTMDKFLGLAKKE